MKTKYLYFNFNTVACANLSVSILKVKALSIEHRSMQISANDHRLFKQLAQTHTHNTHTHTHTHKQTQHGLRVVL